MLTRHARLYASQNYTSLGLALCAPGLAGVEAPWQGFNLFIQHESSLENVIVTIAFNAVVYVTSAAAVTQAGVYAE